MTYKTWAAALMVSAVLAGCGDSTGPEGETRVDVAFATSAAVSGGDLTVTGTNGTLVIQDVRMIVAELELEGPEACAVTDDEGETELEECEFESGPFLLDLPLGSSGVVVATANVPAGIYTELEFEVEDLEEEDGDDFRGTLGQLRQQMRAAYPNFPDRASVVVRGTFTPVGGTAQAFTVYLDAELEVEVDLVPALVIDDGDTATTLTVQLDPTRWFVAGGAVMNLAALDGQVLEFEAEFENGVVDVEWDDD